MNIGVVCYPTFGGSGVVATELGKAMAKEGHKVHFITYSQPVRLDFFSENLFYHDVQIADYPLFEYPPYELALAGKIVDVVKYEKLDLLHVHYAIPHASAAYMARQILAEEGIHIPFITTLHGTDITLVGKDSSFNPVVTFAINQSNGITAVSQQLKDATYEFFAVRKDIKVIPNFIDLNRFNRQSKVCSRSKMALETEKIIMHISNFREVKRVEDVVKVFAKIIKKIPSKLLMVGDGPERSKAEQLCRSLNIYSNVRFLGRQEAIEELLSMSDLFIMPSSQESFGLAALEAMACQVPVISTNVGGLPELNIHGLTGFLSNVGDIEDMARNSIYILQEGERLKEFKANALARAKEFDIYVILPQYERYYEEVIAQYKADK